MHQNKFSLQDHVEKKIISEKDRQELIDLLVEKKNICIVGSAGSGKTIFAQALANEVAKIADEKDRVVVCGYPVEIQSFSPTSIMISREGHQESFKTMVEIALSFQPNFLFFDEVSRIFYEEKDVGEDLFSQALRNRQCGCIITIFGTPNKVLQGSRWLPSPDLLDKIVHVERKAGRFSATLLSPYEIAA